MALPALIAVTDASYTCLGNDTLSTAGISFFFLSLKKNFFFFWHDSFPCKESQLLQDTGHSALSVSLGSLLRLSEGHVLHGEAFSFPPLKASRCLVCED